MDERLTNEEYKSLLWTTFQLTGKVTWESMLPTEKGWMKASAVHRSMNQLSSPMIKTTFRLTFDDDKSEELLNAVSELFN